MQKPIITDPKQADVRYNVLERLLLPIMKDERDMIFVRTSAWITLTVWPIVIALFLSPSWFVGLAAVPYLAFVFIGFGGRYGLMLHATGHRTTYKRGWSWLDGYVPWVLGPLLGHTPTSFAAHHMFMHHVEGNLPADVSSTLAYRRDDFLQFVHYWARFFFLGYVHLTRYLWLRGRTKVLVRFIVGELSWYAMVAAAAYVNWAAALVVFVIPMLLMRWLMMVGNFAQHAFVDVNDPANPFRNSTNLINARYNHKAYNDGYHIVHHIKPSLPWTEMPGYFEEHIEEFAKQGAIVFDGLGNNQRVWWLLMTKDYETLARHLVDFEGRTMEQRVAFLQSRVRGTIGERPGLFQIEHLRAVPA